MTAMLQPLVHQLRCRVGGSPEPTDRQLLEHFAVQRDEPAFAELVRRHGPMVLGVARRILRNGEAEDVFQATFLVLARKAASVCWHESVAGWLFPVAYRLALRVRARQERRRAHEAQVDPMSLAEPALPMPDEELLAVLDEELNRLPEHYRTVVLLCYLEGKTQKEAARQLDWTPGEVRGRLDRARERLRQRLVRRGFVLSATAVATALSEHLAPACVPAALRQGTLRAAVLFADSTTAGLAATALPQAVALAQGALGTMTTMLSKTLTLFLLTLGLLTAGGLLSTAGEPGRPLPARNALAAPVPIKDLSETKRVPHRRAVIVLWMNGGPSQLDTFDMKPGQVNASPIKEIETSAKEMRFSEHLPRLARFANHLALIRSLTHTDADHGRATYRMRTGYRHDGQTSYPSMGAVLGRELADPRLDLPRYVAISPGSTRSDALGAGFLGEAYAPLLVGERIPGVVQPRVFPGQVLQPPPLEAFTPIYKDRSEAVRKSILKAFDLNEEKQATRNAFGATRFGEGCLLARRLVEKGVPVVDVTLGGWDAHALAADNAKRQCEVLDQAWSALLTNLRERKMLDTTLIVWMGEFGRTPRINANQGRDHWPGGFTVVLAGGGIKGGVVVGKTSADGSKIEERPVTPAELLATIYRVSGVDPTKTNRSNRETLIPLVEKGAESVKELLN